MLAIKLKIYIHPDPSFDFGVLGNLVVIWLEKTRKVNVKLEFTLYKKWSFPLRISSVNVTKSAGNWGFGHIYWRNIYLKTSFSVQCQKANTIILCKQSEFTAKTKPTGKKLYTVQLVIDLWVKWWFPLFLFLYYFDWIYFIVQWIGEGIILLISKVLVFVHVTFNFLYYPLWHIHSSFLVTHSASPNLHCTKNEVFYSGFLQ